MIGARLARKPIPVKIEFSLFTNAIKQHIRPIGIDAKNMPTNRKNGP
jgi:hypothetical protein